MEFSAIGRSGRYLAFGFWGWGFGWRSAHGVGRGHLHDVHLNAGRCDPGTTRWAHSASWTLTA